MSDVPGLDGACPITDRGVIRARGADAAAFLQGQLTNDVAAMTPAQARLAGFCSAKGRLQASFIVVRAAADEFLLVCAADLLAATLKRLSMFVLRAKCTLADASGELALAGLAGPAATTAFGGGGGEVPTWHVATEGGELVVRLPDAGGVARAMAIGPAAAALARRGIGQLPLADWRWLDVQSGIVTIEAATVDRFVPQMVNHELIGAVDFRKGCYPGQEVVARSQYRGTTKRRTFLFDCDGPARAGQDVFAGDAAGEPVGTVASAAAQPGGRADSGDSSALVELRLAALAATALHLGSIDGPLLRRAALPYDVPLDSEAAA